MDNSYLASFLNSQYQHDPGHLQMAMSNKKAKKATQKQESTTAAGAGESAGLSSGATDTGGMNPNAQNAMVDDMTQKNYQPVQTWVTSDEEQKKEIKSANIKELLDNLKGVSYKYKDPSLPGANSETNIGIMAQDLEKSKLGKDAVVEAPHGKMVNTVKETQLAMAALAHLNKRLNKLEGK